MMRPDKRARLHAAGWAIGSAQDFLGLTDEEAALVAVRTALACTLRDARTRKKWTQVQLAEALGSSQSRVAKMESADRSVSIDLLVRALIASDVPGEVIGAAFKDIPTSGRGRRARPPQRVG